MVLYYIYDTPYYKALEQREGVADGTYFDLLV